MVEIKKNKIKMTRGDTLMVQVSITKDGEEYTPHTGDKIRFAAATGYDGDSDYSLVLTKEISTNTLMLKLTPDETKEFSNGTYNYDISLTDVNGDVDTFISSTITFVGEVE